MFGRCPKCPQDARPVLLIGGYCSAHYLSPDDIIQRNPEPKKVKPNHKNWYDRHIANSPGICENCNKKIYIPSSLSPRTQIAHILPKSKFPSVAENDDNFFYACWQCHTDYDNGNAILMPIKAIARRRFRKFKHLVTEKNIPIWITLED